MHQTLGRHEAEIKSLYKHFDRLAEALDVNSRETAQLRAALENAKGGWWLMRHASAVFAFLAGIAGTYLTLKH